VEVRLALRASPERARSLVTVRAAPPGDTGGAVLQRYYICRIFW